MFNFVKMVKYSSFEQYFHGLLAVKPFLSKHKFYGNSTNNCNNKSSNHSLPFKKNNKLANKKVINYKDEDLIKIYKFSFGPFSIWVYLNNSKVWITKYDNFKQNFAIENNFKWKHRQQQSCKTHQDIQLLF
jgi:hypothetical protein